MNQSPGAWLRVVVSPPKHEGSPTGSVHNTGTSHLPTVAVAVIFCGQLLTLGKLAGGITTVAVFVYQLLLLQPIPGRMRYSAKYEVVSKIASEKLLFTR